MLKEFFRKLSTHLAGASPGVHDQPDIPGFPSMAVAADMLAMPTALLQLSQSEARIVVNYMHPRRFSEGTVFIQEGDAHNTGFMALVLEGEVTVENIVVSRKSPITVTVLGPGSIHGDLGLIDGLPRSASCTAATNLCCALLTREGMSKLLKDHPEICAKLVMAVAMRMASRLRDNTEKLKKYVQLTKVMQQEIDYLLPSER